MLNAFHTLQMSSKIMQVPGWHLKLHTLRIKVFILWIAILNFAKAGTAVGVAYLWQRTAYVV